MTDQPRDLAAEAAEISRIHDEGRYDQYGEHPAESIGTLLDYIAALTRELEELRAPVTAEDYGPTLAADINALPDRLKRYVIDLEQRADPAWDVRRAFVAEEKAIALEARVLELEVAIARLRVHLPAMIQHPDEAIRLAADTIAAALVEAGQ